MACAGVARIGDGGDVVGWATLATVSDRCVDAGVAEVSVYVAATARGAGGWGVVAGFDRARGGGGGVDPDGGDISGE